MCGIAGWLDFTQDVAARRDAVAAMTATMGCRGPDDEGLWVEGPVGLGHRRLAVIDPAGGRQPMVAEGDGEPAAVISYSGEAYNFTELRAELAARGRRFRTRSDTEVVLRSYLEWGAGFATRLTGMFACAIWDPRRAELLLVRDRLGIKPLYYHPLPGGVLFGSEPKAILAHPQARAVLDREGLQELLTFANTPGHAIYRGMRQVRPGSWVRVGRSGITDHRYWRLPARPHTDDRATTVETVRGLLEEAVAGQVVADVPLSALLSGGLDSSMVTVLAARALRERHDRTLQSFSVDVVGDGPSAPGGDTAHAFAAAERAGAAHRRIPLGTAALADAEVRRAVVRARDLPVGFADMDGSLYLLFRAIREQSTVVLSGEAADEVFGGYPWFHDPAAVAADTFPWTAGYQGGQQGPSLFSPDLPEHLELDEYLKDRYRDAVADVEHVDGEAEDERRMRRVCHLFLTHFLPVLLDRKDRMSMAVGLEVRVPYCDHRLVEYVFNVPWEMKSFDGREKSLLRAAAAGLVPSSVMERPKSAYPTVADPRYERALAEQLADIVADAGSPVRPLLDVAAARDALAKVDEPEVGPWRFRRVLMESLIRFDEWMRDYRVELAI